MAGIWTESENRILTFEMLFWHSNWVGKCYSISKILFWHSTYVGKCYFDIQNPILTFQLSRKIIFWHSKSYSDIQTESEILFSLMWGILFSRCLSAHPSVRPSVRMSVCPWHFFFYYLENAVIYIHQFLQTHWYQ